MKWQIHKFEAAAALLQKRLDQALAEAIPDLSRSRAKKIIDIGGVHINGRRVRSCSTELKKGDSVELYLDHLPLDPYRIAAAEILFQDRYLIVLNKPGQVETQPTHARFKGTVYEALQWHLRDPFRPQRNIEIGMVQRLDRGTSGLMVFSLHPRSHKEMTRIFQEHEVEKDYLALLQGRPDPLNGEIRSLLARSRQANRVKSVACGGKEALTCYRVVDDFGDIVLASVRIMTGRSHQIRVHMSEMGCPLLGDTLYGGPERALGRVLERPLLHAARLAFKHPVTKEPLEFNCPPPADMHSIIARLKETDNDLSTD